MAKLSRQIGTTSQITEIFVFDTTSTSGGGKTGLTNSNFTAYYKRNTGSASVAITLDASAGVTLGTYEPTVASHGAIKEVDSTNMPGLYEFQLPNNGLASGADSVVFMLTGTGIKVDPIEIELTATSNQDGIHGGMSALPNTACTSNASLLTSGTGTDQLGVSAGKVILQASQPGVTIPTVTTVTNQLTAAQVATGVWQDATAGDFTVASSIGKSLYTSGNTPGAANGLLIAGTNATTSFASGSHFIGTVDTVTTVTNQLTAAAIATGVWQDATSGDFTVSSSIGKSLYTSGNAPGASSGLALVGSNMGTVSSVTGNVVGTVGRVADLFVRTGTAQAGGASTITLDSGASGTNNLYQNQIVVLTGGTGAGQSAIIASYVGSTKIATTNGTWATNPDSTTVFVIYAFGAISASVSGNVTVGGYAGGQDPATLVLGATASSWNTAGTIGAKVNTAGGYTIPTTAQIATGVWQDTASGDFTVSGSIGKSLFTSGNAPGTASGLAIVGSNMGTVSSVTSSVTVGAYSAGEDPATLVLGATASSWNTAGTIGAKINSAGNAGDPWATALPGSYAVGTAGNIVGNNLDTDVGSRAPASTALTTASPPSWYSSPPSAASIASAVLTTPMTESYPALHAAPTLAQAVLVQMQRVTDFSVIGTTITITKLDGATTAYTLTMDNSTNPTQSQRAT